MEFLNQIEIGTIVWIKHIEGDNTSYSEDMIIKNLKRKIVTRTSEFSKTTGISLDDSTKSIIELTIDIEYVILKQNLTTTLENINNLKFLNNKQLDSFNLKLFNLYNAYKHLGK